MINSQQSLYPQEANAAAWCFYNICEHLMGFPNDSLLATVSEIVSDRKHKFFHDPMIFILQMVLLADKSSFKNISRLDPLAKLALGFLLMPLTPRFQQFDMLAKKILVATSSTSSTSAAATSTAVPVDDELSRWNLLASKVIF